MNFLEEAYEAVDAIDLGDPELLCEELGDVLMQVVFHAQIEREAGHFTFAESATVSAASCLTVIRTFFVGTRA